MFLNETIRMLRLGLLKIIPLRPGIVTEIWRIIKKSIIFAKLTPYK